MMSTCAKEYVLAGNTMLHLHNYRKGVTDGPTDGPTDNGRTDGQTDGRTDKFSYRDVV